jgi:ribosome maturation factor RimP
LIPNPYFTHFSIEFPGILAYAKDADEFVRQNCRDRTGWRRDEWAYGPLFICGKFPVFRGLFLDFGVKRSKPRRSGAPNERFLLLGCGFGVPGERFLVLLPGVLSTFMAVKLEAIRLAASRVAASHGLDVVEIELAGPSKERILRIFLEKNAEGRAKLKAAIEAGALGEGNELLPERLIHETQAGKLNVEQLSGITHEDCAAFSRDFGVLLDVEELVPGAEYTLEASSPGLDRKLVRLEDYQRFTGSLIKVQTFEPVRNNRHWQGRLMGFGSQVPKSEGPGAPSETITLDLNAVKQNSKSRKAGVSMVEIALVNIEKAQLAPEI